MDVPMHARDSKSKLFSKPTAEASTNYTDFSNVLVASHHKKDMKFAIPGHVL
jgi:hypothetical protein